MFHHSENRGLSPNLWNAARTSKITECDHRFTLFPNTVSLLQGKMQGKHVGKTDWSHHDSVQLTDQQVITQKVTIES